MDFPRPSYVCPTTIDAENVSVDMSEVATCPFDQSHVMKKSRIHHHIVACMKRYKGTKVPCPYNHTEYFEPENLVWHLSVCPRRNSVEVQRYNSNRNRNGAIGQKKASDYAPIQQDNRYSDENWGFE